jgi:hypothetical protein
MHQGKSRVAPLTVYCALAVAFAVSVSPARARMGSQDESNSQSTKIITALDAPDSFAPSNFAGVAVSAAPDKPDAPEPKIATDSLTTRQSGPAPSETSEQKPTRPPSNPAGQQDENPKRILGFIPNFQTKNDEPGNQPPLTVKQKYALAFQQSVDFSAHIGNLFQAALQQASDGQPHFGQGWGPYAERFGAAEGDQASSAFFIFGLLPSILHDDPRYFRKGPGHSVLWRFFYSATRTVVTRKDSGESTFNIPQVAGQLFQQSISTIYYPPEDRTAGRVFENWGTTLAYNSAYNVVKEFYPDVLHLVFHRHHSTPENDPRPQPPPPPASH